MVRNSLAEVEIALLDLLENFHAVLELSHADNVAFLDCQVPFQADQAEFHDCQVPFHENQEAFHEDLVAFRVDQEAFRVDQ